MVETPSHPDKRNEIVEKIIGKTCRDTMLEDYELTDVDPMTESVV